MCPRLQPVCPRLQPVCPRLQPHVSQEDFEARKSKSTSRMRSSIQPLARPGSHGGNGSPRGSPRAPTPRRGASGGGGEDAEGGRLLGGGDEGRGVGRGSEGDVAPLAVDASVGWDKVGGLQGHVEALKEMVVLPLLYPEVAPATPNCWRLQP